jgi:hypothetical protein
MLAIRFLQIPNSSYPNMIPFYGTMKDAKIMMEMQNFNFYNANLIVFGKENVALEKRKLGMNEMNFVHPQKVSPME